MREVICQVLWTFGAKGIPDRQPDVIGDPGQDQEMEDAEEESRPLSNRDRRRLRQLEAAEQQVKRAREQTMATKLQKGK